MIQYVKKRYKRVYREKGNPSHVPFRGYTMCDVCPLRGEWIVLVAFF